MSKRYPNDLEFLNFVRCCHLDNEIPNNRLFLTIQVNGPEPTFTKLSSLTLYCVYIVWHRVKD